MGSSLVVPLAVDAFCAGALHLPPGLQPSSARQGHAFPSIPPPHLYGLPVHPTWPSLSACISFTRAPRIVCWCVTVLHGCVMSWACSHIKGLACLQKVPACMYLVLTAWSHTLSVHVPLISTDARAASRHDALASMSLIALIVRFLAPGYGIWESSCWSRPSGRCPVCRRAMDDVSSLSQHGQAYITHMHGGRSRCVDHRG